MPDSMNYMNDPNAMPQQGVPMQGWDPAQYQQMQDPAYMQALYAQDPMAAQAMFGNQMPQGYPAYADPMAQQMYGDPAAQYAQQGYYQDPAFMPQGFENPELEAERMAQQQQVRAGSIFGPKDHSPASTGEIDMSGMQQQMGMQPGQMQPQPMGVPMGMEQPQAMPQSQQQMQPQPQPQAQPQPQPQQAAPQQQMPQMQQMPRQVPRNGNPPSKSQATMSLIFGIFSIVFAVVPPIGIILGWLSTRFAKKYITAGGTATTADSGRIFGRVGFVFGIIVLIVLIVLIAYVAGASFGNYGARAVTIYYNNSPLGKFFGVLPL